MVASRCVVVVVLFNFRWLLSVRGEDHRYSQQAGQRRFLVLTQPRSGSTWFVKYSSEFALARGVATLGEIMHPEIVEQKAPELLKRNMTNMTWAPIEAYLEYMNAVYKELRTGAGWRGEFGKVITPAAAKRHPRPRVLGFKLMYHQLPRSSERNGPAVAPTAGGLMASVTLDGVLRFAAEKRVLHVHLVRLNHLDRYISTTAIRAFDLAYHQAGVPTSYSRVSSSSAAKQSGSPDRPVVNVSPAAAFSFAFANARANAHMEAYLQRECAPLGAHCATVRYEALVGPEGWKEFSVIRRRLGLQALAAPALSRPAMSWIPCERRVANWDALVQDPLLGRTVWMSMCRNDNRIVPLQYLYGNFSIFVTPAYERDFVRGQRLREGRAAHLATRTASRRQAPPVDARPKQRKKKSRLKKPNVDAAVASTAADSAVWKEGQNQEYFRFKLLLEQRKRERAAARFSSSLGRRH